MEAIALFAATTLIAIVFAGALAAQKAKLQKLCDDYARTLNAVQRTLADVDADRAELEEMVYGENGLLHK